MIRVLPLFLLLCIARSHSADVVTVDPSGVTTVTGVAPATAPGSGEVKIGGGQIHVNAWLKLFGPVAVGRSSIIGHDGQGWYSQVSNDGDVQEFRNAAGNPLTINNHIKGNFIIKGQSPTTAPGMNEVAIGGGDMQVGRTTPAVGAQVVRGDDPRLPAAFVRFVGATGAITSSSGIQSVTRTGVGYYTINLNPGVVQNGNYAIICTVSHAYGITRSVNAGPTGTPTASSFTVDCGYETYTYDPAIYSIIIMR